MKSSAPELITKQILEMLEAGTSDWQMPWDVRLPTPLRQCGTPYRGINWAILMLTAYSRGYKSPHWLTFNQARSIGAKVLKGEKSSPCVFTKKMENDGSADDDDKDCIYIYRHYRVFNTEQLDPDTLPEKYLVKPTAIDKPDPTEHQKQIIKNLQSVPAKVIHRGSQAYYVPSTDEIYLPEIQDFRDAYSYCATRLHELTHWTGAKKRLDRDLSGRPDSKEYGYEELVAELGSSMITQHFGMPNQILENHASYIGAWIKIMKEDNRAILRAASKAQAAADYLLKFMNSEQMPLAQAA